MAEPIGDDRRHPENRSIFLAVSDLGVAVERVPDAIGERVGSMFMGGRHLGWASGLGLFRR